MAELGITHDQLEVERWRGFRQHLRGFLEPMAASTWIRNLAGRRRLMTWKNLAIGARTGGNPILLRQIAEVTFRRGDRAVMPASKASLP